MPQEQREKEETARVVRQRPVLRVCAELALVGIINDSPTRSGGEFIMKALKDLVRRSYSPEILMIYILTQISFPMILLSRRCHYCLRFSNHIPGPISALHHLQRSKYQRFPNLAHYLPLQRMLRMARSPSYPTNEKSSWNRMSAIASNECARVISRMCPRNSSLSTRQVSN